MLYCMPIRLKNRTYEKTLQKQYKQNMEGNNRRTRRIF